MSSDKVTYFQGKFWVLCVDHVIWTVEIGVEYQKIFVVVVFNVVLKFILGHIQYIKKVG